MPNDLCEICQNPLDDTLAPYCESCQGDLHELEMDRILKELDNEFI